MLSVDSDARNVFRCAVTSCTKTIADKETFLTRKKKIDNFAQFSYLLLSRAKDKQYVVITLNLGAFQ